MCGRGRRRSSASRRKSRGRERESRRPGTNCIYTDYSTHIPHTLPLTTHSYGFTPRVEILLSGYRGHAASLRASLGPGSQCPITAKRQSVTWCPLPAALEQAVLDEPLGGLLGVVGEDDVGARAAEARERLEADLVRVGVRVRVRVRVRGRGRGRVGLGLGLGLEACLA